MVNFEDLGPRHTTVTHSQELCLLPLDSLNVSTEMKSITFNIGWFSNDSAIREVLTRVKAGHLEAIFHSGGVKGVFLFLSSKYVVITDIFLTASSLFAPVSQICRVCCVWFEESVSG